MQFTAPLSGCQSGRSGAVDLECDKLHSRERKGLSRGRFLQRNRHVAEGSSGKGQGK